MSSTSAAQAWTDHEDENGNVDFYRIMSDFNSYWEGKEAEKGKGYKPMKRWEYKWKNRLDEEGDFPAAGYSLKTFNTWLRNNPTLERSVNDPWTGLGPNSNTSGYAGTGRVMSIAWHPSNSSIYYVGSAGGGLWKTTNDGASWSPKTDDINAMGISAILIDPNNANTIYIGTGDCDGSDNYSIGVLKSTDGGDTWNTTGLDWSTSGYNKIYNMVFDPDDNNTIILASNAGIYRTTNGGISWTQTLSGSYRDIDLNPDATTNTLYVTSSSKVYRSTNNGVSWSEIYSIPDANRLAIAATADDSDYLYILASNASNNGLLGIWRSEDAGDSFTQRTSNEDINLLGWSSSGGDSGGQGWYDLAIAANPDDAEVIHVGGVNNWGSDDGGLNWDLKSHWSGASGAVTVHADKHLLEWHDGILWEGNDGGIYQSSNSGDSWTDKTSDMVISQMYKVGIAETDDRIIAGLQDNGTKLRNNDTNWVDEIGGDGMDCAINPSNSDVMYGSIQRGKLRRSTNAGGSWTDIKPNIPGNPNGAWVTPYMLDPSNPTTIIAGYKDVWRSTNEGTSWTSISDDLSSNNLTFLAMSPTDSDYIYAGTSSSLYRTTDGGTTWNTMSVPGSSTAMVKVSPSSPETIYAVRSSFSNGNKVYKSTNGGSSWNNISGNLPNLFANCIEIHDDSEETIYVGMDIGVYYKNNSTPDWTLFNVDLPNVEVKEIEIKESDNEIYLATYGRGVWKNNTIGESSMCDVPQNIIVSNITTNSFDVNWSAPDIAPADGYLWAYSTDGIVPTNTNVETGLMVSLTNLESGTGYYFHLRSDCGDDLQSAWLTSGPHYTNYACGDTHFDTGGENGEYSNGEDYTVTLCPSPGNGAVTLTFTSFEIESNWDALYLYDGDDINAPQFDSGNPATQAGFPAGGYYGTDIPGPFTSTAGSGCITLRFRSDAFITDSGWATDISCANLCEVTNLNDNGEGSLRDAINCTASGEMVSINPSLYGSTILLNSQITITKDVLIMLPETNNIDIATTGSGPLFLILSNGSLELDMVNLNAGTASNGSAIINIGSLIVHEVEVSPNINNSSPISLIQNNGTLEIKGNTTIND